MGSLSKSTICTTCLPSNEGWYEKESAANEKEKTLTKKAQQRQVVIASVGVALLLSSIVLCASKMYIMAVVGGIVGLACIGFVLYNVLKPNTKLEKVEFIEQPVVSFESNIEKHILNKL